MNQQPSDYTEPQSARSKEFGLILPTCMDCCRACRHHEHFGKARFVVWCVLLDGHVPSGASCEQYELLVPDD